jgi:hypothetical protein
MSNNNPEEIYLQTKRIDEEETFLSKDIKRQQREIDNLIDEKVKEMKNIAKSNKNYKKTEESEEKEEQKGDNNQLKRMLTKKSTLKFLKDKKKPKAKTQARLPEIEKKIKNIKSELIELSIDYTQKCIKEKSLGLSKNMNQKSEKKVDKKDKGSKKQQIQEIVYEDLPYEKEIKEKREKEKKNKEDLMKKKQSAEALSRIQKNKLINPSNLNNTSQKSGNDFVNKSNISQELSCIGDLSLSKHDHSEYLTKNSINLKGINSYLIDFDNDNDNKSDNISKIDNKIDLTNESLISKDDEKPIKSKIIKLKEKDNLYSKVQFEKPSSILTSILD